MAIVLTGLVAMVVLAGTAMAAPAAPEELLLDDRTLAAVGVTADAAVDRPLPARPECRGIQQARDDAASTVVAIAARRSAAGTHGVLLDENVRQFATTADARAFVQPYRDEDPAEECVEAVLSALISERGVVTDTFADDRTVPLGGAPSVAYLAEATYQDGDRERKVRAEQIIGRSGSFVADVLVVAPDDEFVEAATKVERALASRMRAAGRPAGGSRQ